MNQRCVKVTALNLLKCVPVLSCVFVLPFLIGCGSDNSWSWLISTPAAEGMDGTVLDGARQYAFQDGKNTQGVVVVRHDKIVAEWYAPEHDVKSYAASWSMAKSFTSALIGIAIDKGLIPGGLDAKMSNYITSWQQTDKDPILLRDVLSMASGLDWTETSDPNSNLAQMVAYNPDELTYAASLNKLYDHGTFFNYSSGDAMLLSAVISGATGMRADEYAAQVLFEPLELTQLDWWRDADEHTLTYCCIDTTSRNFAHFGLLFLHQGTLNGKNIVSQNWVVDSTSSQGPKTDGGYGHLWWLLGKTDASLPADTYAAKGLDSQFIYVIPSKDLVVVRNGLYAKNKDTIVADPTLFQYYPADAYGSTSAGTLPPDSWSNAEFLTPIVDSIKD